MTRADRTGMLDSGRRERAQSQATNPERPSHSIGRQITVRAIIAVPRHFILVLSLALAVSVTLLIGQESFSALAEGFGWGTPGPVSPAGVEALGGNDSPSPQEGA
ncbi:hypothetical protein ACFFKH_17755 [Micromonospora marina]|uniref:hypothetical protein n=1 Tax=Micromonospora marina TaxID=307120 RepID=UPI00114CDF99|nr:hypothetical protein [Micromonospora marina]